MRPPKPSRASCVKSLLALVFLVCQTNPATADTSEIDGEIAGLISGGEFDVAAALLETADPSDIDRLFFDGRILKAVQQFDQAIAVFREVLRLDPTYIAAKRELAHTLLLTGNLDVAEFHFRELLRQDQNRGAHADYRYFLDTISSTKPFGFSGQVALLPSTNVNRGTSNTRFGTGGTITDDSREESGTGVYASLSGYYRRGLSTQSQLVFRGTIDARKYSVSDYNQASGTFSVAYERAYSLGSWSIEPYYRHLGSKDAYDSRAIGARAWLQHEITPSTVLAFSTSYERQRYPFLGDTFYDGPRMSGSVALYYQFRPDLSFSGGLRTENNRPERVDLQYKEYAAFANLDKAFRGGLNLGFGVEVGNRRFQGPFASGGFLDEFTRSDDFYSLRVSAGNSRLNYVGFTPTLTCTYSKNRSNADLYDYTATDCKLALTRNF